jgi:hypothetical protein
VVNQAISNQFKHCSLLNFACLLYHTERRSKMAKRLAHIGKWLKNTALAGLSWLAAWSMMRFKTLCRHGFHTIVPIAHFHRASKRYQPKPGGLYLFSRGTG